MTIRSLADLFIHTLKVIYYAENRIKIALPKIIEVTANSKLRGILEDHLDETENQIDRLNRVFRIVDVVIIEVRCPAIVGIIDDAEELLASIDDVDTRDAAIIVAVQAIEHYEINRYGTLCVWAQQMKYNNVRSLLEETLKEEKNTNDKLNQIARSKINKQAAA